MRCPCCAPTLISPATLDAVEQERTTLAWFHFRQDDGIRLFRVFSKLRDSGPKTVLSFKAFAHYFHVDPTKVRRARLLENLTCTVFYVHGYLRRKPKKPR
jgi:hypothetical protein